MKLSQRLKDEKAFVEAQLPGCICHRCKATLATYGKQCSADLDDACPGFLAIEAQKRNFIFNQNQ